MHKKLESVGNFLEKNFEFHNIILLKKFDKIKKLIDVLDQLNIYFMIIHRGKSPMWLITKLNNTDKFSNYKNFVIFQYEYGNSFSFNFETSSFSINNDTAKELSTSADITLFDTIIYGEIHNTKHLHEKVTADAKLVLSSSNCFNFSNTK